MFRDEEIGWKKILGEKPLGEMTMLDVEDLEVGYIDNKYK